MTRRNALWQKVLDELIDDPGSTNGTNSKPADTETLDDEPDVVNPPRGGLDEVTELADSGKRRVVEQAPLEPGQAADDLGQQTRIKFRIDGNGDQDRMLASLAPADMMQAGHGYLIDDRSTPWKTARRMGCANCGGPLPRPKVDQYVCEFDPEATELELSLIGIDQGPDDRAVWPGRRSVPFGRGCQCSGCILRHLVANGDERNRGQPRKACSDACGRMRGNELKRWKAAVNRAEERGLEVPPEPEDKGLKLMRRNGLRSGAEGTGHRYSPAVGLPWGAPRA